MSGFLFKIKIHRKHGQSLKALVKYTKVNSDFTPFLRYLPFRGEYKNGTISRHQTVKNAFMYRMVQIRDFDSFWFSRLLQQKLGQSIFYVFQYFLFISRCVYRRKIKFSRYKTLKTYLTSRASVVPLCVCVFFAKIT